MRRNCRAVWNDASTHATSWAALRAEQVRPRRERASTSPSACRSPDRQLTPPARGTCARSPKPESGATATTGAVASNRRVRMIEIVAKRASGRAARDDSFLAGAPVAVLAGRPHHPPLCKHLDRHSIAADRIPRFAPKRDRRADRRAAPDNRPHGGLEIGESQVVCLAAGRSRLCVETGFVAAGTRTAVYVRSRSIPPINWCDLIGDEAGPTVLHLPVVL